MLICIAKTSQALYDTGVDGDTHSVAQSCLLLSYHSETTDLLSNTKWLAIAIQYARVGQANQYHGPCVLSNRSGSDLKRLWWCCIIRDRIISLGMRRPIQIPPTEFDFRKPPLTASDLADEIISSEVYEPHTKIELCKVLTSLCELVVCLTDVTMALYPAPGCFTQAAKSGIDSKYIVERLKLGLTTWRSRCRLWMDSPTKELHPSVTLNVHLTSMYYE